VFAIGLALLGSTLVIVAGGLLESKVRASPGASQIAYLRLAPLGHSGVSDVMTALAYIRQMAHSWDLTQQDRAGQKLVDKRFLAFMQTEPGFVTFAEFMVIYEMLHSMNFDGATQLAQVVLEQRPQSTLTSYALAFMLDRVFGKREEGGVVLVEATKHADLPQWVGDLGQRMIRGEPDPLPTDPQRQRSDFICDLLAKMHTADEYPKLLERCKGIGTGP
jgi:hypothetical protein